MYCEILQHRHTERKLESVNTGDASTHWSILQLSLFEIKECSSRWFWIFRIPFTYRKEYCTL